MYYIPTKRNSTYNKLYTMCVQHYIIFNKISLKEFSEYLYIFIIMNKSYKSKKQFIGDNRVTLDAKHKEMMRHFRDLKKIITN